VLARNGGAAVVNLSSLAGLVNFPLFVAYSASKAGTHSLTQAARLMLRATGLARSPPALSVAFVGVSAQCQLRG
jgi:short-subunit dehydrogenase